MFDLMPFEQSVTPQTTDQALNHLCQLLGLYERGLDTNQHYNIAENSPEIQQYFTHFATLILKLFSMPSCKPSLTHFYLLCLHKNKLIAIFEISEFGNTDPILKKCLAKWQKKGDKQKLTPWLMKALLFISFNTECSDDLWPLLQAEPEYGIEALLGLLGERRCLSIRESESYFRLMQGIDIIKDWPIHDHSLPQLSQVWYQDAYELNEMAVPLKCLLNALTKNWMSANNISANAKACISKTSRGKMLVVLESFSSKHAMYRCFINSIIALGKEYELVALSEAAEIDDVAKDHFAQWIEVQCHVPKDIAALVQTLNAREFDAVCYTSIGMKYWALALANLRLAPVQFTLAGHPTSSHSAEIDFLLLEEEKYSPKMALTEQVIGLPSGNFGFILREHSLPKPPAKADDVIRIAITATAYKLHAHFLQACQKIQSQCTRKVEFHFFTGTPGLVYHQLCHKLRLMLADVFVYPGCSYDDYLHYVSRCDLSLAPFPFGGTNSTVDAILLAIPGVTLAYPNIGCADPHLYRKVGMDEFVVTDVAEYIARALLFIHDDAKRMAAKHKLEALSGDLGGIIGSEEKGEPYLQVVSHFMQRYAALKSDRKPFIPYQECL